MSASKYKNALILFLIYVIGMSAFLITLFIFQGPENLPPVMISFIPYPNYTIELIVLIAVIWPIAAIIGAFLAGFIFTPLFLSVHKSTVGRNMIYGIQVRKERPKFSLKSLFKSFFPSLMAINFALLVNTNETVIKFLLAPTNWSGGMTYIDTYFPAFMLLLIFTIIIAMASFSSIWFLYEAGMVYSSEKADEDDTRIVEIKSVGGFYNTALNGYAGIGAVLTFYTFILLVIAELLATNMVLLIINIVIFLLFPFLIMAASIPAMIILDRYKGIRNRFVLWLGRRHGIKDKVEVKLIQLEELDPNELINEDENEKENGIDS